MSKDYELWKLKEENERLKADADRYRWLVTNGYLDSWNVLQPFPQQISEEIDFAMKEDYSVEEGGE